MKLSLRNLFAAAGLLVAATTGARAEEISLAPNFEPFAAPEVTLVSHCTEGCDNGCNNGCTSGCCDSGCNSCCTSRHVGRDFWTCNDRCGGIVGGLEFLYIEPFANDGVFGPGTGVAGTGGTDIEFEPAYRFWAGWENSDGLGARIRYFTIDANDSNAISFAAVDYSYIDAEVTQSVAFRRSSLQFAGGFRYAEAQNAIINVAAVPFLAANEIDGFGLTFAAQANRDITRGSEVRMTANARWSLLYGDNDFVFFAPGAAPIVGTLEDEIMQIVEINAGPQLRIKMRTGGYLTAFGGVEAQYWQNSFTTPAPGVSIDTGFAGLVTSVSITR